MIFFSSNNKIQTHVQAIRSNLISNPDTAKQLMTYGLLVVVYVLLNVYLGVRGWQAFSNHLYLPAYVAMLACVALILPIAAYLLDQGRKVSVMPKMIAYAGFYWTAFFIYAVIIMILSDIAGLINQFGNNWLFKNLPPSLLNNRQTEVVVVFSLSVLLLAVGTWLARQPRITGYLLNIAKPMPRRPLRIVLLSDIHYGSMVSTANLEKMARRVKAQHPDLILLAGDLIDNSLDIMRQTDFAAQMSRLQAPLGVFAVLGNHELVNADVDDTVRFFSDAGIRVLLDETVTIADQLILAGRRERKTEFSGPLDQMTPQDLLADADHSKPIILMQHQPADLAQLEAAGIDIAVAGHTHGGQLFPLNILNRRHFTQTAAYRRQGNLHSIISDGYGTWGPPIRLGSRAEIVVIDLTGAKNS